MNLKLIAALAVTALLGACATPAENQGAGGQGGNAAQSQAPQGGSQAELAATAGDRVFFAFNRSDLSPEARSTLQLQADFLRRYPQVRVTVMGHADERGTREYNLALANRRAIAARDFLVAQGVDRSRIETVSFGKECPRALGTGEANWSQNRRSVTGVGAAPAPNSGCPVAPFL